MPDRKQSPIIHEISELRLPEVQNYHLSNGIPVYEVNMGTQDIMKLEVIFEAGRPFEQKHSVARATATMLKEGTHQHKSAEIAEFFDFYGASIGVPYNLDNSSFTLYALSKHLETLLPMVAEILTQASFPETELSSLVERYKQRLQVDLNRGDVVAYRELTELIYGAKHPYGYNSSKAGFEALLSTDLRQHFSSHFHAGNCTIVLSGKLGKDTADLLEKHLGQIPKKVASTAIPFPEIVDAPRKVYIPHNDKSQSAIRIGRILFNRKHSDFPALYVLSTLLGGYFGSRLMMNIREQNGYTYGVYSSLDTMRHSGFMYIATEVGNEFIEPTLEEIYKEFRVLRETEADAEELQMLRNYLMGTFLNALDGPFNSSELVRALVLDNLPLDYFHNLIHTIQTITPKQLQNLAQQYLKEDDFWQVVVGSKPVEA